MTCLEHDPVRVGPHALRPARRAASVSSNSGVVRTDVADVEPERRIVIHNWSAR
jgi:hypothetical protein